MAKVYRFDDVQVDLRNFRVLKAGKAQPLEPKALNVLVFLIEQRGRLVEKRELLDAVWGDIAVTENVLTRAVAQLRKLLADDAKDARYIETVPTRGYRFIADPVLEEGGDAPGATQPKPEPPLVSPVVTVASPLSVTTPGPQPKPRWPSLRSYTIGAVAVVLVCVVAVLVLMFRQPFSKLILGDSSPYFQIASNTQITTAQGLSFYPTFSPDGTSMAYATERGKGFEIFVRQLQAGGQEVPITSDGGQNMEPAWSPDGKVIAFHSHQRGGIWLVPALGGTTRQLTEFGSHPAWSHDGQSIAFQAGALDDFSADSTGAAPPSTLWVIRLDGSNPRQITKPGNPEGGHGAPSWSPDGKHIVFVASIYGSSWLWSVGSDGSGPVRLAGLSPGYYDPVYSPDGKSVVYGAIAPGINYGLWQVRVSPDTSAPLGEPVEINNSGGIRIKNLAFSADGRKLLYAAISLSGSLHSLPIEKSGEPAGEPVTLTSDAGCRSILPAFSSDGSRIAFHSCRGRPGLPQQIWLMNADGSHSQQLTPPGEGGYSTWYPDGRRILFVLGRKLFSIDTETRQQKLVREVHQDFGDIKLSPDGTQLATDLSVGGILNIWLMDMASGRMKQLTFDGEMCSFPAWSPDGKYIAAEVQRAADNAIVVLPSAGGPMTQLTPYHGQNWIRSWSPDGDRIIFAKQQDDSFWNIWSVSRSTKAQKQLTHYRKLNAYVRYPDVSPRGNQIVYEYTETTGNIWMFEFK